VKYKVTESKSISALPPIGFVLLAVLLWSTGGLFIKSTSLDPFMVNAGRSLFAAVTVAVFTYRKGLRLDRFTLLNAFLYAGTLSCFVYANKTTTAANAIFLQYTAPIYILALAPAILKEKFKAADLITVAACIAGMSLFFVGRIETAGMVGNLVALASGAFFGLYFICLRHPRSLQRNPAISVFYGNILIVIIMLPILLSPILRGQGAPDISPGDLLRIMFLGIFQIGLAYILFTKGIAGGVRSLDASIVGFIEPLLNPVWVFLFIGERPSPWALLGGGIIISAVIFHTLRGQNERRRLKDLPA
jgi:drug/metabolite transporter, DME family